MEDPRDTSSEQAHMAYDEALAERVRARLSTRDFSERKMFET